MLGNGDAVELGLVPDHQQGLGRQFAKVERLPAGVVLARQRTDAPDHLAGPQPLGDHVLHRMARLAKIRLGAVDPAQACAAVGHDAGQRLVDLVGDRRRQLAQRGHARHVRQLGLHPLALLVLPQQLGIQPRILQRDGGLGSQQGQKVDPASSEQRVGQVVLQVEQPHQLALLDQRQAGHRAHAAQLHVRVLPEPGMRLGIVEHEIRVRGQRRVDDGAGIGRPGRIEIDRDTRPLGARQRG